MNIDLHELEKNIDIRSLEGTLDKIKPYIQRKDYDSVYKYLLAEWTSIIGQVTAIFYCSGVDPLNYIDFIPDFFLRYVSYAYGELSIKNGITTIGRQAFFNCYGLTRVTIPDSVINIGGYAFYNCTGLTSITIGNGVTRIGGSAFLGCTGLTIVTIPDSVTSIGEYAFYQCNGMTGITYLSTKEKWNAISKGSYWDQYTGHYVIHCIDGSINKE